MCIHFDTSRACVACSLYRYPDLLMEINKKRRLAVGGGRKAREPDSRPALVLGSLRDFVGSSRLPSLCRFLAQPKLATLASRPMLLWKLPSPMRSATGN